MGVSGGIEFNIFGDSPLYLLATLASLMLKGSSNGKLHVIARYQLTQRYLDSIMVQTKLCKCEEFGKKELKHSKL